MALSYKLLAEGKGIQADEDGNPLVIDDANEKEFAIHAIDLYTKIPALQTEARVAREEKQAIQIKFEPFGEQAPKDILSILESFKGIEPQEARDAISTVANLGELDKEKNIEIKQIKEGVADGYKSKMVDIDKAHSQKVEVLQDAIQQKDNVIRDLLIRGAFDRSEFIKERTFLTPDIAYDSFGKYFRVEENGSQVKVVPVNRAGDPVFSKANPGDHASPEEAIEMIINEYHNKDSILLTNSGGSGAGGNKSVGSRKKAELAAIKELPPSERLNRLWS